MTPEPETLLFQTSPLGTIDAIVQHDDRCVYFFLNENPKSVQSAPRFGTRSVWVRNLQPGPLVLNRNDLENGIPTPLPRTHTICRDGLPLPNPDHLSVVWFEEGNAAALIEKSDDTASQKTLAVIPPWSGMDGFHGYAADCGAESEVCWPMPKNPMLGRRIDDAVEFWQSCDSAQQTPFSQLQPNQLQYYHQRFSTSPDSGAANPRPDNYFSIDGGKFPPRGLTQHEDHDSVVLLTVGMALLPQPMVEMAVENPGNSRRIELGLRLPKSIVSDARIDAARKKISQLAAYPWSNQTWLGSGHSVSLSGIFDQRDHAILIDDDLLRPCNVTTIPNFRDDPIRLLWIVPRSERELEDLANQPLTATLAQTLTADLALGQ